ncbi:MAG: response regulator [Rikenellaceae bacterium]
MNNDQEEFLKELLADFKIEAYEHYQSIVSGLLYLEKESDGENSKSMIEQIFREAHSLKGAARAVNLLDIEKLCVVMESLFNSIKKGEVRLTTPLFDALYSALDILKFFLDNFDNRENTGLSSNFNQIIKNLEFIHKSTLSQIIISSTGEYEMQKTQMGIEPHVGSSQERPVERDSETIRISSKKLVNILNQAENFVTFKSTLEYFKNELSSINSRIHEENLEHVINNLINFQLVANRMINDLTLDIKSSLLLPFSSLLNLFPKIVRDLSKEYLKKISITILGENTVIDRRILEEIKDPLVHLIRNCIDHGIETPEERRIKGKSAEGKIEIVISQEPNRKISIKVADDGAGIDRDKIIQSSVKNGIIDSESAKNLSEREIYSLIFNSGVSSRDYITDISGRGLGMAIVAEKVAKLGGTIELSSAKDKGSTFIIKLPQVLSIFRGILVISDAQAFIIPSVSLEKTLRIKQSDISYIGSKRAILYSGESVGLVHLSEALGSGKKLSGRNNDSYINILILSNSQKKMAFAVDEIIEEQEGIVKELGSQLLKVNKIAGVTVLGDGKVVPIIEVNELIESISKSRHNPDELNENLKEDSEKKKILIAEDSITVRTMLRNFIENSGYIARTAVDGVEAYNILQTEDFDLVVTDIEMPGMNGFELTAKLREQSKHSDLPIILVTALESIDDQRKGMEMGANAYIVKGSFEKSNLLETIKRLI